MDPLDSSAGFRLDSVIRGTNRDGRDGRPFGTHASSGLGRRAGAGTEDSGPHFHARPMALYPAQIRAGVSADRDHRWPLEPVLAHPVAAGGLGSLAIGSGRHAVIQPGGRSLLSLVLAV